MQSLFSHLNFTRLLFQQKVRKLVRIILDSMNVGSPRVASPVPTLNMTESDFNDTSISLGDSSYHPFHGPSSREREEQQNEFSRSFNFSEDPNSNSMGPESYEAMFEGPLSPREIPIEESVKIWPVQTESDSDDGTSLGPEAYEAMFYGPATPHVSLENIPPPNKIVAVQRWLSESTVAVTKNASVVSFATIEDNDEAESSTGLKEETLLTPSTMTFSMKARKSLRWMIFSRKRDNT